MDRRTDITKLIVAFRNFANAPKKSYRSQIRMFITHKQFAYSMFRPT
jgi:hypothetical protein